MEQLRVAQNRMDNIELPSDIGRIPPKIAIGNGRVFQSNCRPMEDIYYDLFYDNPLGYVR